MKSTFLYKKALFIVVLVFSLYSCKLDEYSSLETPSTYSFQRNGETSVLLDSSRLLIDMHLSLDRYMRKSSSENIDLAVYENMLKNNESPFLEDGYYYSYDDLNNSDLSIWNYFVTTEEQSDEEIVNGDVLGEFYLNNFKILQTLISSQGYKELLLDDKGFDIISLSSTCLMGLTQFYPIIYSNHYISPADDEVDMIWDNSSIVSGTNSTEMELVWDSAYAMLNLPEDILENDSYKYLSKENEGYYKYNYLVNSAMYIAETQEEGIIEDVLNLFREGRTAIVNNDLRARYEVFLQIQKKMSLVLALNTIYYIEEATYNIESTKVEHLEYAYKSASKAYGFIYSMSFAYDGFSACFTTAEIESFLEVISSEEGLYKEDIVIELEYISEEIKNKFIL